MNDVKLRDAKKILKKNNFEFGYVNGDHWHFFRDNQRLTLVFHVNRGNACPYPIWSKNCKKYNIKY